MPPGAGLRPGAKSRPRSSARASKRTRFSSGHAPSYALSVASTDHVRRLTSFSYQAGSWNKKRPVVAEWRPGELVPRSVSSSLICRALPSGWSRTGTAWPHHRHSAIRIPSVMSEPPQQCRSACHALAYEIDRAIRHEDTGLMPKRVWSRSATLRDNMGWWTSAKVSESPWR